MDYTQIFKVTAHVYKQKALSFIFQIREILPDRKAMQNYKRGYSYTRPFYYAGGYGSAKQQIQAKRFLTLNYNFTFG